MRQTERQHDKVTPQSKLRHFVESNTHAILRRETEYQYSCRLYHKVASDTGMAETTTYVLLIRHGENDWVGSDRLAGRTPGVHLNDKGHEQARELAALLAKQPITAIFSSPLERCMETALPLAKKLDLPATPEAGVLEVDYGDWRGQNLKELAKDSAWKMVQHFPSAFRFPGGETLQEVQSRAVETIARIHNTHPNQTVAIFSHGDVIRTTLAYFLGTHIDLFQRIAISTASVSILALHNQRPMVLGMNYVASLPVLKVKSDTSESSQPEEEATYV